MLKESILFEIGPGLNNLTTKMVQFCSFVQHFFVVSMPSIGSGTDIRAGGERDCNERAAAQKLNFSKSGI